MEKMHMRMDAIQYTIGQVSDLTNIPQSALRYWETVFDVLKPQKSPGGNRKYSEEDIKLIFRIKELLYEKGYTIKGANLQLNQDNKSEHVEEEENLAESAEEFIDQTVRDIKSKDADPDALKFIIRELKSILRLLED
jgi:DNA-binding transcriptional MerR regulator